MEIYRILITGACGVTSRSVVRSLNKSDYFANRCEFIGTDICYNLYGVYEGLYKKVYKVPGIKDSTYRSVMQRIIDENHIEYAIIMPEPEVLYWSVNPFDINFLRIPPIFAKFVLSKLNLYRLLQKTGLTPKFQLVDKKLIQNSLNCVKLDYPMWIRDY